MTWDNRLRPEIELIAPDGQAFKALWKGDERARDKKIGQFNYPGVDGSALQDLGSVGIAYPLKIYFDGPDHDLESERFFVATAQRGPWTVTHPTKGRVKLQLFTVTEKIEPVERGNITVFETQWMEPIKKSRGDSLAQRRNGILGRADELRAVAAGQATGILGFDAATKFKAITSTAKKVIAFANEHLAPLYAVSSELTAQRDSINRGMDEVLSESSISLSALTGSIQNLIELPLFSSVTHTYKVTAYTDLLKDLLGLSPDGDDPRIRIKTAQEIKNAAAIQELAITACVSAIAQAAPDCLSRSRSVLVENIEAIAAAFSDSVAELDKTQQILIGKTIDQQYFSQSKSFDALLAVTTEAARYLLALSYGLNIERRFTLQRSRVPIEIVITELGGLGENDSRLDDFIEANGLKGTDILLLKSGREVVIYG